MVNKSSTEVLGIVQARGGSKSIPRKNIRPLGMHPLIAYSIKAGLVAQRVTRLIVSTDDYEIAEIARSYGAETPFLRPAELARDDSGDLSLFQHALKWLKDQEGYQPDLVVQLRPTSPFRPSYLIDQAIEKIILHPEADCVRSVTVPHQNPFKMWQDDKNGFLYPLLNSDFEEPYNMPRQRLPVVLWQTGHVDVVRAKTIVEKESMTGDLIMPIEVDRGYCVDIDNEDDWLFAQWLLEKDKLQIIEP